MRNGESSRNAYVFVSVSLLLQIVFLFTSYQSLQTVDEIRTSYGNLVNDFYLLRLARAEDSPPATVGEAVSRLDEAIIGLLASESLSASARLIPDLAGAAAAVRSEWETARALLALDDPPAALSPTVDRLGARVRELEGPIDQMVDSQRRALQVVLYVLLSTVLATIGIFFLIERDSIKARTVAMQVKSLAQSTIGTQEQERARIARALHDSLAQELGLLILYFGDDAAELSSERSREIRNRLVRAVAWLRNLAYELHPAEIEEVGLPSALSSYCDEVAVRHGAPISCEVDESVDFLPHSTAINVYRIAQEAVTNAIRHAKPTRVTLSLLNLTDRVVLTVEDNGIGFRTDGERTLGDVRGLGLVGMRERANIVGGQLLLNSEPGAGARVEFYLEKSRVLRREERREQNISHPGG